MELADSSESFGPYQIVRRIAVGGMSEVLLARHHGLEGLERQVVIKRIREGLSQDEEFRTMFLDEARLMAALCHPNVAQVFELGHVGQSYHLIMEYVRGPTLNTMLHAGSKQGMKGLPPHIALHIAMAVAEAMAYVHSRKDDLGRPLRIVHRDLKPANIIVSYDGAVKLIDFGIAKAASKVYETRTGVIKGTFGYIAPEQLTRGAMADHRVDVFALGVILYEMIVGNHPFDVSDNSSLLDRMLNGRYERPRRLVPTLPRSLEKLMTQCLAPHPEGRPETMNALIRELIAEQLSLGKRASMGELAQFVEHIVPDTHGPAPVRSLHEVTSNFLDYSISSRPVEATVATAAEGKVLLRAPAAPDAPSKVVHDSPPIAPVVPNSESVSSSVTATARSSDWDQILTRVAPDEEVLPLVSSASRKDIPIRLSSTPPPTDKRSWPAILVLMLFVLSLTVYLLIPVTPKPPVVQQVMAKTGVPQWLDTLPWYPFKDQKWLDETDEAPHSKVQQVARTIRITSDPQGATIMLNGKVLTDKTPADIEIPADLRTFNVRLSKSGYAGYLQEISAEIESEHFILLPLRGNAVDEQTPED